MSRMRNKTAAVIGGVDTHADTHQAAALNEQGRLLGVRPFATTEDGYRQLLAWLRNLGPIRAVGIEGSGSYGAGLTRHLRAAGVPVVEVNRPHAHTRARRGKTDAIDAEAAARKVLAGECTAIPKDTTGIAEAIRQLHLARASAVQARTAALNQLDKLPQALHRPRDLLRPPRRPEESCSNHLTVYRNVPVRNTAQTSPERGPRAGTPVAQPG